MPPCLYNEYYSIINQLPNYPKESFYFENSNIILKKKVMNCDFLSKSMDCAIFRIKLSNVQTNVSWDIKSSHIVHSLITRCNQNQACYFGPEFSSQSKHYYCYSCFSWFPSDSQGRKTNVASKRGKNRWSRNLS